jgi:hypothetical protein
MMFSREGGRESMKNMTNKEVTGFSQAKLKNLFIRTFGFHSKR